MTTRRLLEGLLFASGASALVYQVVWFRALALTFGVTAHALAIVLAAFMGGLALGSVIGGRIAHRTTNPLRWFGAVELATAGLSVAIVPVFGLMQAAYAGVAPRFIESIVAIQLVRFAFALGVLLVPTACMGMTFPLAARASTPDGFPSVGRLYAANTFGAVVGVLIAGFVLVGLIGLAATAAVAAVINLAVALTALARSRGRSAIRPLDEVAADANARRPGPPPKVVLTAFALAGFASLAYEVLWFRLAAVVSFGVVYGFSLVLATLLCGIAVGSALYERWAVDRPDALRHFAWLEFAAGAITVVAIWTLTLGAAPLERLAVVVPIAGQSCAGCVGSLGILLALLFACALVLGAAFPAGLRACMPAQWSRRLGAAYAANVVGSVVGSLVAGFTILPRLGAHRGLLLVAGINVGVAVTLAVAQRRGRAAAVMLALGAAALLGTLASGADVYRTMLAARLGAGSTVTWYDEGLESSVAVGRRASGQEWLVINGEVHGGTHAAAYHRQFGLLASLLHPAPRRILVIGLGTGATSSVLAMSPGAHVDVVELSPGVVAASRRLATLNDGVLDHPRISVTIDDGRNHLLLSGHTYDLIVADILQPKHAGAGVIFSNEFFALARRRLNPGGLMVQWLGTPDEPREYTWTARTFAATFPHTTFWMSGAIGVGSNTPQRPPDPTRFQQLRDLPALTRVFDGAAMNAFDELIALQVDAGRLAIPRGPLVTDDRPCIEYFITLPLLSRLTETPR